MLEYAPTPEDRVAFLRWLDHDCGLWSRTALTFQRTTAGLAAGAVLVIMLFLPFEVLPSIGGERALICLVTAALAGLVAWFLGYLCSETWTAAARLRTWKSHPYHESTGLRRVWLDTNGLNVSVPGTAAHWDWSSLADVQSSPDHFFVRIRSHPQHNLCSAIAIPRRLGRSADVLEQTVRAQLADQANATSSDVHAWPGWSGEAPGELRFELTPAEQVQRLAWDSKLGGFAAVTRRERKKLAPALAMVPVLALLWTPALWDYPWTATIPALAVTVGSVISVGWAWHTAPNRSFLTMAQVFGQLCQLDPVGDRGRTRVWLDGAGVTIQYAEVSQHFDWEVVTDVEETPEILYFAACGISRAAPRRADPARVAWLAAGLRAGTARAGAPVHGDLAAPTGPMSIGFSG